MARAILYGSKTQMVFDEAPRTLDEVMLARVKFIREMLTDRPIVFVLMDEEDYRTIERVAKLAPFNDWRVRITLKFDTDFFDICGIRFSTPEREARLKASL